MFSQKQEEVQQEVEKKSDLTELLRNEKEWLFKLDYEEFIQAIQGVIPESLYLQGKAEVSAEGIQSDKPQKNVYGLTEDEEIRAFSGLLRFKDVINGERKDYENFIACQIEMKKPVLSFESFQQIREYVLTTLNTPEDYAAAMWSILCNDLGKVHSVIEAYHQLPDQQHIGHDLVLAEMLARQPKLFPAFDALTEKHRQHIIAGYASSCDISQFEQLEVPLVALKGLTKLDKEALDLYVLHTIFDVAGAAAHFKPNGSLTMHADTWKFFYATKEALDKLHHAEDNSIEAVYANYLQFRGNCVGIDNTSPEATALIRIAGLGRLATKEQGDMLLEVWKELPESKRERLITEFNVPGNQGLRGIFIGYGPAMIVNAQNCLKKGATNPEQQTLAFKEGLKIALLHMAVAFKKARHLIKDAKEEYFVSECDVIAKLLSTDPRGSLQKTIKPTIVSDRRVDFEIIPRPVLTLVTDTNSEVKVSKVHGLFCSRINTNQDTTAAVTTKPTALMIGGKL